MNNLGNLTKIKGDASFRKFFRKRNKNFNSIVVFAKKEKFKNLLVYDSINKILNHNKILAPKLYKENYSNNFIEIEDFGNNTVFKILSEKKNKKLFYFKKVLKILSLIQSIKTRGVKTFRKKKYTIPKYDKRILINEANLFCDWYAKKYLPKKKLSKFIKEFKKEVKKLAFDLKLKNNIFVHRDFHVSNLMWFDNQIGVIDSQDAIIGNRAYDLASLIDDVRFKTSMTLKNRIYELYLNDQKKLNKEQFKNDFEILSILRNLKIIGIFSRLSTRDNKNYYLKLIPHAWKLIGIRINRNKKFQNLKKILIKNFKNKLYEN